jgi:hypothetical protein
MGRTPNLSLKHSVEIIHVWPTLLYVHQLLVGGLTDETAEYRP